MLIACTGDQPKLTQLYPELALNSETIDFAEVIVEETHTLPLQIINAGQATLYISDIRIDGEGATAYQSNSEELQNTQDGENGIIGIERDQSLELMVSFTPDDFGEYPAVLHVDSNDEDTPTVSVSLTGEGGDGPQPQLEVSSNAIDFGNVQMGTPAVQFFNVTNIGDAELEITNTQQSGSGAFTLDGDLDGKTLSAGASTSIIVTYVPTQDTGDNGVLTIESNDPYTASQSIDFIGNGGGDFVYPIAQLVCPTSVLVPDSLSFDGAASSDPSGQTLNYHWELSQQPAASTSELRSPTGNAISSSDTSSALEVDVAGTYLVSLVVENEVGTTSSPAECLFEAIPPDDIHIELSWTDTKADFDLHLLRSSDGFFSLEDDCCWCNSTPDWGAGAGNPVLQMDSEDGSTPEVITIPTATDGEYFARVHYFSDNGAASTNATVRVFLTGQLVGQYNLMMAHNEVWTVGFVRWPQALFAEESSLPISYTGNRSCQ